MTAHTEPDPGLLQSAWRMLQTTQPLDEMLRCPALKGVLVAVAKGLNKPKLPPLPQPDPIRTRQLHRNLSRFDGKRAAANDFD